MKKIITTLFVLIGILAATNVYAVEKIEAFQVIIQINKDASLNIEEKIDYNFGQEQKHGIIREIPIKYKARGGNYNLRISDICVTDENNKPYNFTISYPNNYFKIKIGDPDTLITGENTYIIGYTIKRAINYFEDYDELYWNVTGDEWPVQISNAKAIVSLPENIKDSELQKLCFAGSLGITSECDQNQYIYAAENLVSDIVFEQKFLTFNEGLTFAVGLPKGVINQPKMTETIGYTLQDNWVLIIPLLIFIFCFYWWYTRGRDPEGRKIIIAQFDPPDKLSPAETGTVYDAKTHGRDISAEIINLAIKGYLKITRTEEDKFFKKIDYTFEKIKEPDNKLNSIEENIMISLFELHGDKKTVKLSNLKNKFHRDFRAISNNIWQLVVNKKYFTKNYKRAGTAFIILGFVLIIASISAIGAFIAFSNIYLMVSLIMSGIIFILFGIFMPKRTKKGVLAKEHILGLKEYLKVAEKDRIKFHNAPEKNPQEFERLLPYAMVLGVEKQWAKQFKDIYIEQKPNWYSSTTSEQFSALALVDNLTNFKSVAAANLSSSPSSSSSGAAGGFSGFSSGGGFSGGGFGGGGGSSW